MIGENVNGNCYKCGSPAEVTGSQFCTGCYYPGINADWRRYSDLVEEGYSRYQASVMAGLADPTR